MAIAIEAEGLSKKYRLGQLQAGYGTLRDSIANAARRVVHGDFHHAQREEIWALEDVSFEVTEGEVLGVVGRNGAGKSTLLKLLTRITTPTKGRAEIRGRVGSLLEVGTGFHPELTGRENVYLNGAILGMKRREITRKFDDIVEFAGISKFIDTPVKRYSSGMYVRLAFSVAAHLEPEILLVDEVLAVGDAEFQRRCLGRMEDYSASGRTVLFVSHNMAAIAQLCSRVLWLDSGRVLKDGPSTQSVAEYLQSGTGTASRLAWPDLDSAPGDDVVRLLELRVVDETGDLIDSADVRDPVGIELRFAVLGDAAQVFPKLKVTDDRGDTAFNALDTSPRWLEPSEPGTYVSTAWIPGNLLNEGLFTVHASVCSPAAPRPQIHVNCSVSFHVHDAAEGDSSRGAYGGQWQGPLRPLLEWQTDRISE
jgi:lipopolysaccharide transport system ATP-binding protein